jgi:hypothetical protein
MSETNESSAAIKTDEKKQHFDDIYVAPDPVPFKERIIDALDYISDDHNRTTFNRLVRPWLETRKSGPVPYLDLCCCFGNTTLAVAHQMTVEDIKRNWADARTAETPGKPRQFELATTGIDISQPALDFTRRAGIFDHTIAADLNQMDAALRDEVLAAMAAADVLVSTAALVYLDLETVEALIRAYAEAPREGYAMVNFLNPFSLEKSDATKRLLLEHLDFVGSTATRHRRMSPLEQENYPGEEWALLEIWVLKRRG